MPVDCRTLTAKLLEDGNHVPVSGTMNFYDSSRSYDQRVDLDHFLGSSHYEKGDFSSAVYFFTKAHKKNPTNPFHLANLGSALQELGDLDEAIVALRKAVELKSAFPVGYFNLGNALTKRGLYQDAVEVYDNAIGYRPDFVDAYVHRGIALSKLGKHDNARTDFESALKLQPSHVNALVNLGNTLVTLGCITDAISRYDAALSFAPLSAEAHYNKGKAVYQSGNIFESIGSFDRAISIRDDYANAKVSKAIALLHEGNFEEGWRLYEWRWKSTAHTSNSRPSRGPAWLGDASLSGRTVFLRSEQGLGDTIQFCRYVPMVKALGARVILEVPRVLFPILSSLGGVDELVLPSSRFPACDYECALMSLPLAFRTSTGSIPANVPYLRADERKVRRWRQFIGNEGFKIGINWQGNIKNPLDVDRSFPLGMFSEISKIQGVRLISLQKQFGTDQLYSTGTNFKVESLPADFDSKGSEFMDTAAVIECVDLVISCDSSVAHLAGSLGAETWVALPFVPDWRWMGTKIRSSPWYPRHKLYRQSARRDWGEPFHAIAEDIKARLKEAPRLD